MNANSSKTSLLQLVTADGKSLQSLRLADGIQFMLAFYRNYRGDGCPLEADGDMLLFQWGTSNWGQGEFFEFDITRQFIEQAGEDDEIRQLSLTFKFESNDALRSLQDGNRWCRSPAELEEFRDFIEKTHAYEHVGILHPARVELDYEGV